MKKEKRNNLLSFSLCYRMKYKSNIFLSLSLSPSLIG